MTIGLIILLAIPLAVWVEQLPDLLGLLLAGAPRAWLTLFLGFALLYATLAIMFFIAKRHLIHPVLRDARRIGRAGPVSVIRLMAELTSRRELRRRIIVATLAGLLACVPAYLSSGTLPPSHPGGNLVGAAVLNFAVMANALKFCMSWYQERAQSPILQVQTSSVCAGRISGVASCGPGNCCEITN